MIPQIKHRAKAKGSGQWVYGFYARKMFDGSTKILDHAIIPFDGQSTYVPVEIDPATLGVFIKMLKDKEVYTGDILDKQPLYNGHKTKMLAKFNKNTMQFSGCFGEKIIGNMFDNPELIDECTKINL